MYVGTCILLQLDTYLHILMQAQLLHLFSERGNEALLYYLARSIQTGHVIVLPPAPVLQCAAVGVRRRPTERTICIAGTLWRRRHLLPRAQVNAVSGPASHRPNGLEQHLPRDVRERDVGAAAHRRQARRRGRGGRGCSRLASAPVLAAATDGHVA
jgi:hypothetical protein